MIKNAHAQLVGPTLCAVGVFSMVSLLFTPSAYAGGGVDIQPKPGSHLPGLNQVEVDRFFLGKTEFSRVIGPGDGLGPVFNQNSCSSCHNSPAVGGSGSVVVTRFGHVDPKTGEFDPLGDEFGGSLNQDLALNAGLWMCDPKGKTKQEFDECVQFWQPYCAEMLPDQIQAENPELNIIQTHRITNSALGLGLIESIPDQDIVDYMNWQNANTPAQGRIHWVKALEEIADPNIPDPPDRAGRMGWKAQLATVQSFSADASLMEMGLTSWILPNPVAPNNDQSLMAICDSQSPGHPELQPDLDGFDFVDRVTDFQRFASPPPQTPREGMTGEVIFTDIGCADCHRQSWITADDPNLEDALRNTTFKPYSDFLLHDMGTFGDGIVQDDAEGTEHRTPALWGVRNREPLMHDGSISLGTLWINITDPNGVLEAHRAPDSTAGYAADNFFNLTIQEQELVVQFLDSLGRLEFDSNGDNDINEVDFFEFAVCFSGTADSYMPPDYADQFNDVDPQWVALINIVDHPCAIYDIDTDGFIDESDFEVFLSVFEGFTDECTLWEWLVDMVDESITVTVPGECLPCPGDFNDDGTVNVSDLLAMLGVFGNCPGCQEDLNDDGVVNVSDLLQLLGQFGACPE